METIYKFEVNFGNGYVRVSKSKVEHKRGMFSSAEERQFRDKIDDMLHEPFHKKYELAKRFCQKYDYKFREEKNLEL